MELVHVNVGVCVCVCQVKEDEMGVVYSTHGRGEKCIQNFGRKI